MKTYFKIISILLLFSVYSFNAQKYDATLYFLDGTIKNGKADAALNGESKLLFKENNSNKKEKIKVQLLDKVEYLDTKTGETITLELKEFNYYVFSDNPKTEYNWMRKISSGDISVYVSDSFDGGIRNNIYYITVTPSMLTNYFFQYKDEKPAMVYFINSTWTPNKKSLVKRHVKNFFKDKCPQLVNDFESEKLQITDHKIDALIKYYEENCSQIPK
ncbi:MULTISPECIES: hypothetical protein [Chryseobacterium]|uniref:hypothetical protein n=1 Tax=Chryseobacterium TaxID=59732 RepID=UPI00195E6B82|nr:MULTISPECIES: hypothetical protein [Chryseobacterium]MBM7417664.1 hypothetical protein [Chryseobacterium sp. JUb44]MDH6211857.1 hypothetical protein [Chryseobacterium sp. BIGb0186]WSO10492.1 hypothetical protein VUJ64_00925 [Chryseobacterium scophthalmum]